jgi:hypothetical protein
VVNSRDGQVWTAKTIMQPKDTSWRGQIVEEVLSAVRSGTPPTTDIPTDEHLKRFCKKLPKPVKAVAIAATKKSRRFKPRDEQ